MSNNDFDFPEMLDGPPPAAFADAYEQVGYRQYALTSAARAYIAEKQSELAAAEAKAVDDLQTEQAVHAKTKQVLRDRIIGQALHKALMAAGSNPNVRHGAVAQLMSIWNFSISDDDGVHAVSVKSGDAEHDLHQAVVFWLSSDAGAPFSTRRPPTAATQQRIQQIVR
jgi:hypothetical protein